MLPVRGRVGGLLPPGFGALLPRQDRRREACVEDIGKLSDQLTGEDDPKTTRPEAEAWREHTSGAFTLRVFPGGHFFLADHQADVDAELAGHLDALRVS